MGFLLLGPSVCIKIEWKLHFVQMTHIWDVTSISQLPSLSHDTMLFVIPSSYHIAWSKNMKNDAVIWKQVSTRPGVDKVKPKGWLKYSLGACTSVLAKLRGIAKRRGICATPISKGARGSEQVCQVNIAKLLSASRFKRRTEFVAPWLFASSPGSQVFVPFSGLGYSPTSLKVSSL